MHGNKDKDGMPIYVNNLLWVQQGSTASEYNAFPANTARMSFQERISRLDTSSFLAILSFSYVLPRWRLSKRPTLSVLYKLARRSLLLAK